VSFGLLALLLREASEACGRAEFEGFGLLMAGNLNGFEETFLGF